MTVTATATTFRVSAIVTDIEGTTSSIHFVPPLLFPFARAALPDFVRGHADQAQVRPWLDQVAAETGIAPDDLDGLIAVLRSWMDEDRKHTALKAVQGLIWAEGYAGGAFAAHLYPEVAAALRRWHAAGIALYVYSSGSIAAQQLFFGHSTAGDLRPLFSGYFDTTSGGKRETPSYHRIATAIGLAPEQLLFLSDIREELDAAATAGWYTTQLVREDAPLPADGRHLVVRDFDALRVERAA